MDRVIFACRHNAGRSQMAAAFFNQAADPSRARAVSAGTTPAARVHPEVAEVMREVRIDLSAATPQLLTADLAGGARLLVTMGCGEECPYVPGVEVQDWALEDPKGRPVERVREIRDEIRARVASLIAARGWAAMPANGPDQASEALDVFQRMPKVELHVHLDCCLSQDAVAKLAPGTDRETYLRRYVAPERCASLADFLRYIDASLALLQTAEGLRVAVDDLFGQFRQDNVLYAEIRFAPLIHLRQGLSPEDVVRTVAEAVSRNVAESGIEARVILCALRHFSAEQSLATARLVSRFRGTPVTALDLAADEAGFPLDAHVPAFALAREQGIPRTAHAGEARGPESVRETLAALRPGRIGHGVRSVEDPELPSELRARGIHLEVCPSCNIQTGIYTTLAEHPVDRLRRMGVSVGINTDARGVTGVTLSEEYRRLHRAFGWGAQEFLQCNRHALEAAFLDAPEKRALLNRLEAGDSALGR